jgi:hypothetical protein
VPPYLLIDENGKDHAILGTPCSLVMWKTDLTKKQHMTQEQLAEFISFLT